MEITTTTLGKIFTGYGSNFVGKHSKLVIPSSEYHTLYSKHVKHRIHVCLKVSQGDGLVVLLEAIVALQRLTRPGDVIIGGEYCNNSLS